MTSKLFLREDSPKHSDQIIMVDDDELDFLVTQRSLKMAFLENEVLWLDDGQKLLSYLGQKAQSKKNKPNYPMLIFLDINMPTDASTVLNELERLDILDHLKIVLLSNSKNSGSAEGKMEQIPFIRKPLTFDKLYQYILKNEDFIFQKMEALS